MNYAKEARLRHREIIDTIERRLSPDIVFGRTLVDSLLLPWRSKVIFIAWEDNDTERIITELDIH
jgi:hypothetical protein